MFRSAEQKEVANILCAHIATGTAPLLLGGGTGLGKLRAILFAAASTTKTVAIVLPSRQLIDQLVNSVDLTAVGLDVAVFKSRRDAGEDFDQQKADAMAARVMVCTSASVVIDQFLKGKYNGSTTREILIFDEADQLPAAAALQSDFTITAETIASMGLGPNPTKERIVAGGLASKDPELKAAAKAMEYSLENPAFYRPVGFTDDRDLQLFHTLPGRMLKKISNRPSTIFVSATLQTNSNFADFTKAMGITSFSALSRHIEPKHHGEVIFKRGQIDDLHAVLDEAPRPVLVIVPSFALAEQIAAMRPDAILRQQGDDIRELADRAANGILIAPAAWAGLDTTIRWASVVVPRVPFGAPTVLDNKHRTRYVDSVAAASRRMTQSLGRGLRSPTAKVTFYCLDDRVDQLKDWVPARFRDAWKAASAMGAKPAMVLELNKHERNIRLKRAALAARGCSCSACGVVPPVDLQLDLHCADITDRPVTLDDVALLCKPCHAELHKVAKAA